MNTKIVFTRNSPLRTVLVNEATGQELYRIETPPRFVGSVTRVFRCDPATPSVPDLAPRPQSEYVTEPYEGRSSYDWRLSVGGMPGGPGKDSGDEGGIGDAGDGSLEESTPLVKNEIARLYWRWFKSPRMVFEGKIRTRAEYMPLKGKLREKYIFHYKGVAYRWSMGVMQRPKLVIDSSGSLMAQFHPISLFKREKAYLEVTPAGMDMLDHIIVTFIPVDVDRRKG